MRGLNRSISSEAVIGARSAFCDLGHKLRLLYTVVSSQKNENEILLDSMMALAI